MYCSYSYVIDTVCVIAYYRYSQSLEISAFISCIAQNVLSKYCDQSRMLV